MTWLLTFEQARAGTDRGFQTLSVSLFIEGSSLEIASLCFWWNPVLYPVIVQYGFAGHNYICRPVVDGFE